jgi:PKD repeat protein
MKKIIIILVIALSMSCEKETIIDIKADFEVIKPTGKHLVGTYVLNNKSQNGIYYFWNINDGRNSNEKSPILYFEKDIKYQITLKAYTEDNESYITKEFIRE